MDRRGKRVLSPDLKSSAGVHLRGQGAGEAAGDPSASPGAGAGRGGAGAPPSQPCARPGPEGVWRGRARVPGLPEAAGGEERGGGERRALRTRPLCECGGVSSSSGDPCSSRGPGCALSLPPTPERSGPGLCAPPPGPPWAPPPSAVVRSGFKRPRRPGACPVCGRRRRRQRWSGSGQRAHGAGRGGGGAPSEPVWGSGTRPRGWWAATRSQRRRRRGR